MSKRITSFDGVKGHDSIVRLFREQLDEGTFPHFVIIEGEEGLGKTSLADLSAIELVYGKEDSAEKQKSIQEVIVKGHSTNNIKKYRMSVEGGKDAVKDVLTEFNTALVKGNKVIIMDECHGMSSDAQDVLLNDTDTGRIPNNLYVILLTTEISKIKSQLRSRAVCIHLNRLNANYMLDILKSEVQERGLEIQGGDVTLGLIANWAEYKPRTALSILDTFSKGSKVSAKLIKELIGYLEVEDVLPIVTSLTSSLTWGLDYIGKLRIDQSIVDVCIEILKVRLGNPSYKLRVDEMHKVKMEIINIPEETLMKFVYTIAGESHLTRSKLIAAFIKCHISYDRVMNHNPNTLKEEEVQRSQQTTPPKIINPVESAPTMNDLLANCKIVEGGNL